MEITELREQLKNSNISDEEHDEILMKIWALENKAIEDKNAKELKDAIAPDGTTHDEQRKFLNEQIKNGNIIIDNHSLLGCTNFHTADNEFQSTNKRIGGGFTSGFNAYSYIYKGVEVPHTNIPAMYKVVYCHLKGITIPTINV